MNTDADATDSPNIYIFVPLTKNIRGRRLLV